MFETVYIDMDGVLADFDSHFENLYGTSPNSFEQQNGQKKFWQQVYMTPYFFRDMPKTKYFDEVLNYAKECADNICILSSPSRTNQALCLLHKRLWIDKHLGENFPAIFEKDKHIYASSKSLLIDDTKSKIDKWEKAGGKSIYFTGIESLI